MSIGKYNETYFKNHPEEKEREGVLYGVILVNKELNRNLNIKDAEIYINWIISDSAKILINNFKKNGQQLFFFNHH